MNIDKCTLIALNNFPLNSFPKTLTVFHRIAIKSQMKFYSGEFFFVNIDNEEENR